MPTQESLTASLRFFALDGDLDIEDVDHAAQIALEDGRISTTEAAGCPSTSE